MTRTPRIALTVVAMLAVCALAVLSVLTLSSAPHAAAGEPGPGTNCSDYYIDGSTHVCVIDVGDTWFCEPSYLGDTCQSVVEAGDTVVWDFGSTTLTHTATHCGASCDNPTNFPDFDSGLRFDGTYDWLTPSDQGGTYNYHCQIHPQAMLGQVVVLGNAPEPHAGDVNCDGRINSVDAALVLQLGAGLLVELPCQDNADVNEDGQANSIDAALILQRVAGLLPTLPF